MTWLAIFFYFTAGSRARELKNTMQQLSARSRYRSLFLPHCSGVELLNDNTNLDLKIGTSFRILCYVPSTETLQQFECRIGLAKGLNLVCLQTKDTRAYEEFTTQYMGSVSPMLSSVQNLVQFVLELCQSAGPIQPILPTSQHDQKMLQVMQLLVDSEEEAHKCLHHFGGKYNWLLACGSVEHHPTTVALGTMLKATPDVS